MPELLSADGKPIDVDAAQTDFAQMMSAPEESEAEKYDLPAKAPKEAPAAKPATKSTRTRSRTTTKAEAKPVAAQAAPSPELQQQRSEGIAGLMQIGAAITLGLAASAPVEKALAWKADTVTLANMAKPLGDAVADACAANPQFAKAVDKITAAGPYAALVGVTIGMTAQLAANHGIKAAQMFGAVPPEQLAAQLEESDGLQDQN